LTLTAGNRITDPSLTLAAPPVDPTLAAESGTLTGTANSGTPTWLQRIQQGNAFHEQQAASYPYNEVYIDNGSGGYYRLNSYNPAAGEIVSLKYTQFSDIQESTGISYVNEIPAKYSVGSTIANVPSSGELAGDQLQGQYILEVPPQAEPIPQSVIDAANKAKVFIRDTNGKIYNSGRN